jgi:hypothetical protein
MDPRHTLYRTFENLTVNPENLGNMSATTEQETAKASSGVTPEGIERKLKDGLGAVYVEIADLSGMLFSLRFPFRRIFCLSYCFYLFPCCLLHFFFVYFVHPAISAWVSLLANGCKIHMQNMHIIKFGSLVSLGTANSQYRRMRPNVRSHHRLTTVHQEDHTSTPPTRQLDIEG